MGVLAAREKGTNMDKVMNLLRETAESAFLLGPFLYAVCFVADSAMSKFLDSKGHARPRRVNRPRSKPLILGT
jgi:hypothetical protein